MNKISVLQVGNEDLSLTLRIPEHVTWNYFQDLKEAKERSYDVCILSKSINEAEAKILLKKIRAYTMFILDTVEMDTWTQWIYDSRVARVFSLSQLQDFLNEDIKLFFSSGYGEKFGSTSLSISQDFDGSIFWNGYQGVELEGDYGQDFNQIAFWRWNVPLFNEQVIEFWLEYEKDDSVKIQMEIFQFQAGSISTVQNHWTFTEEDLSSLVIIENKKADGPIFVSLSAKGSGKLKIVNLHDRYSRKNYGMFFPGGVRLVTSKREEIFLYFDPGDMKPPLNVYFSGWKKQESFEGYNMMKKMGAPFLLVTDNRLRGGAFYLGDEEYENLVIAGIQDCLDQLGFNNSQLILSGLSMGTFGSLYYGCQLKPHAFILGKPLGSLGDIADNERIKRPGVFPTSLDVLSKNTGGMDKTCICSLNDRFWNLFDQTDWSQTKFIMSYLIEDDYDPNTYKNVISHIRDTGVEVIGKGIHGRHNDNTYEVVQWFKNQYENVLKMDFGRNGD